MNDKDQRELGNTLWSIADQLRGAMNADDFRDYMLSFLFLRYLSDNYETQAKKELGRDYPAADSEAGLSPLRVWYEVNFEDAKQFEAQMQRKVHYVIKPEHLWSSISEMARHQDRELLKILQEGFKYIENESFQSSFKGLFSEINLDSEKLGRSYKERNDKLCTIITKIAEGIAEFSTSIDILGDAYEYLIGQFAAGSGKKAGNSTLPNRYRRFYRKSSPLIVRNLPPASARSWTRSSTSPVAQAPSFSTCVGSSAARHRENLWPGKEHHNLQLGADEHASPRGKGL